MRWNLLSLFSLACLVISCADMLSSSDKPTIASRTSHYFLEKLEEYNEPLWLAITFLHDESADDFAYLQSNLSPEANNLFQVGWRIMGVLELFSLFLAISALTERIARRRLHPSIERDAKPESFHPSPREQIKHQDFDRL